MIQLSVVIITYNEERNIGRCIDSAKTVADDIVVVDSFSTDKTKEICESKGVRFVQHKFEGYVDQKNWAITQAKYPYILSLDADEVLSDELLQSIAEVKNNWRCDGYYMNRLTNYCGKWIHHCGWYPDRKLRLFDSRKGKWTGVLIHEKFELAANDNTAGFLKGDLLHYSYYTVQEHLDQTERFTDIAARELKQKGKSASFEKLVLSPVIKFIGDYFFRLGFLDGYYGFTICRISARATFLKYSKLKKLNNS